MCAWMQSNGCKQATEMQSNIYKQARGCRAEAGMQSRSIVLLEAERFDLNPQVKSGYRASLQLCTWKGQCSGCSPAAIAVISGTRC